MGGIRRAMGDIPKAIGDYMCNDMRASATLDFKWEICIYRRISEPICRAGLERVPMWECRAASPKCAHHAGACCRRGQPQVTSATYGARTQAPINACATAARAWARFLDDLRAASRPCAHPSMGPTYNRAVDDGGSVDRQLEPLPFARARATESCRCKGTC